MSGTDETTAWDLVKVEKIEDFIQAVEVAIVLGAKINVLPGMSFYQLTIFPYEGNPYDLGFYSTEDAAETALANWVIRQWDEMASMDSAPWDDDDSDIESEERKEKYLKDKTDEEIIDEYFESDQDTYEINYNRIAKNPVRDID